MTKLDPKKNFFLTLGISILIVLVIGGGLNYFLFSKVVENAQKYSETKKEFLELAQKREQAGELEKNYKEKKEVLEKINSVFIDSKNPLDLILLTEDIIEKSGNSAAPRDFTVSGEKEEPSFLSSSRTLSGDFQGLIKFLKLFENMQFYADITSINIGKVGVNKEGIPQLSSTINFKVYSR